MAEKTTEAKSSTKAPMIYGQIAKVMEDVGVVAKNSENKQQGFMFRGIDAVMNALNPAMVKNKVFAVPRVVEHSEETRLTVKGTNQYIAKLTVEYDFFAEDGSFVTARVCTEAADSADKNFSKALSTAFKYACFQTFCIPTEEMKEEDPEGASPEDTLPPTIDELKQKSLLELSKKKGKTFTKDVTKLTFEEWKFYMDSLEKMEDAPQKEVDLGL